MDIQNNAKKVSQASDEAIQKQYERQQVSSAAEAAYLRIPDVDDYHDFEMRGHYHLNHPKPDISSKITVSREDMAERMKQAYELSQGRAPEPQEKK